MKNKFKIILLIFLFNTELYAEEFFPDLNISNSQYGQTVSIDNEWMAVGAPLDYENGQDAGAAYIYKKVNSQWVRFIKILGEENSSGQFGTVVLLDGEKLFISAVNKTNELQPVGAVYVYQYSEGTWNLEKTIQPTDLSFEAKFGQFLAINNGVIYVSATEQLIDMQSSGVLFAFDGGNDWQELFQLESENSFEVYDFGRFVHVDEDWLTVSALQNENGYSVGQVNIYIKEPSGWQLIQQIKGNLFDKKNLGRSVDILGGLMVIGATYSVTPDNELDQGEVSLYNFNKLDNVWELNEVIDSPIDLSGFGWNTKLIDNKLYVSSRFDIGSFGYPNGNLYIYFDEGNGYEFQYRINDPYYNENQYFTQSVSFVEDYILIGAPGTDIKEIQYGMVSLHQQKYKLLISVNGLENASENLGVKEIIQNTSAFISSDTIFSFGYIYKFFNSYSLEIFQIPKSPNHNCSIVNQFGNFYEKRNITAEINCEDVDTIFDNSF